MKIILLELLWVEGNLICLVFVAEKENFKCLSNRTGKLPSFNYISVSISWNASLCTSSYDEF